METLESENLLDVSTKSLIALGEPDETAQTYTLEELMEYLGHGRFQNLILFLLGFILAADGMEVLLISIVGPVLQCEWFLSDTQVATISTAVTFGMLAASQLFGLVSDKYGRRNCILLASAISAYFSALSAFSPTFIWVVILRCLVGCGLSAFTQLFSMTLEFLPSKTRARTLFLQLMWSVGGLLCGMTAILTLTYLSWRWFVLLMTTPAFVGFLCLLWMPETPRYCAAAGEYSRLYAILQRIASYNRKDLPDVNLLVTADKDRKRGSIRQLCESDWRRKTILLALMHFVMGLTYYGIVFLAVMDLEGLMTLACEGKSVIHCSPCHVLGAKDFETIVLSTVGELLALPVTYVVFQNFGGRLGSAILFAAAAAGYSTLLIVGFAYMIRFSLVRLLIQAVVLCLQTFAPIYYPTRLRGVATGLFNIHFRTGAFLSPFLAQVLAKFAPRLTVLVFVTFLAIASILAILLPKEKENMDERD